MEQQMPAAEEESGQDFDPNEWARKKGLTRKQKRKVFTKAAKQNGRIMTPSAGRVPSRIKTGTTPHFQFWMADLKLRSELQRLKLNKLAETADDEWVAAGFALLYISGVGNVFKLLNQTVPSMLKMRGMQLRHLEAVEDYLISKAVKPRWTAKEDA